MKLTDNKKAHRLENKGLIAVNKGILTMSSLALSFNEVNFSPVAQNGQIWLTAPELASALGYSKSDAVGQVYERNKDEFNSSMTTTITVKSNDSVETLNLSVSKKSKNLTKTIRIFSLRGAHLIAMFSKTAIAKQFRKWVLDVLDKHVGVPVAKTHKSERTALHEAHALLVTKTKHLNVNEAWKLIHQRFNVDHIEDIPYEAIPVAVEYVHHLVAMFGQADKSQNPNAKNIDAVARHMLWLNHWWSEFGDSIGKLSPMMRHGIHDHFKFGAENARQIVGREVYMPIFELAQKHNWHKCDLGFKQLQECGVISYNS